MDQPTAPTRQLPTPQPRAILCPYCGNLTGDPSRCDSCRGYLDALSRQATQNSMGPWFVRDPARPFRPGCSLETIQKLARAGQIGPDTILRGPTTGQFWVLARRAPGISHIFGLCPGCQAPAQPDAYSCKSCGAVFESDRDRQHLGLGPIRPLPGQESPELVAARIDAAQAAPQAAPKPAAPSAPRPAAPTPRSADPAIDPARIRRIEKQFLALRSRLFASIAANAVLALALIAALVLLSTSNPSTPTPAPVAATPQEQEEAQQFNEIMRAGLGDEGMADLLNRFAEPEAEAETLVEPAPEPSPPDRAFDITLLEWADAEAHLLRVTDRNDPASIERGLELLVQYEEARGSSPGSQALHKAWRDRLEQLALRGMP